MLSRLLVLLALSASISADSTFTPQRNTVKADSYWDTQRKTTFVTPGGYGITASYRSGMAPIEIDTIVTLLAGVNTLDLNTVASRGKVQTAPTKASQFVVRGITRVGTDTTMRTYQADLVQFNGNSKVIITSSDNADTGRVHVSLLIR